MFACGKSRSQPQAAKSSGIPLLLKYSAIGHLTTLIVNLSSGDLGTSLTNYTNFPFYPVKVKRVSFRLLFAFLLETDLIISNNRTNLGIVALSAVFMTNQRTFRILF